MMNIIKLISCVILAVAFSAARAPLLANVTDCFESSEEITPWTPQNIGQVADGASRRQGSAIEICSVSYGSKEDALRFLHQMASGDFEMVVRIDAIQGSGLAGLMARANESHFRIGVHRAADGQTTLQSAYKAHEGETASAGDSETVPILLPLHLKLKRSGATLFSEYSSDGRTYTEHLKFDSTGSVLADRDMSVGMVQSSDDNGTVRTALFDNPELRAGQTPPSELISLNIKQPLVGDTSTTGTLIRGLPLKSTAESGAVAYLKSNSPLLKVPKEVAFPEEAAIATVEMQALQSSEPTEAIVTVELNDQRESVNVTVLPIAALTSFSISPVEIVDETPRAIGIIRLAQSAPPAGVNVNISVNASGPKAYA